MVRCDDSEHPDDRGFRGPQVCSVVGITYRQLDYWARTDLVRPSLHDAKGSGTQRLYSYRDLVELKVVKSLLDAGVSLQTARKAIDYLRSHLGEDLASASLVLDGSKSVLAFSGDQIVDLLRHGQGVLNIVPLARGGRRPRRGDPGALAAHRVAEVPATQAVHGS